jgi:hypothetical protein
MLESYQAASLEQRQEALAAKRRANELAAALANSRAEVAALKSQLRISSVAAARADELQAQLKGVLSSVPRSQLVRAKADAERAGGKANRIQAENAKLQRSVVTLKHKIDEQSATISALNLKLRALADAARVLGGDAVVRGVHSNHFRDRVRYEAVSAEMEALDEIFDDVGPQDLGTQKGQPTRLGDARTSKARASQLLREAATISPPDLRRQYRSAAQALHPGSTPHADKRNAVARTIRLRVQGSATPVAAALEEAPRPRHRRISLVDGTVQGLGEDSGELFAKHARERLPIMDGWLAQSMAAKMEHSRQQARRLEILKQRLQTKGEETRKLRRQNKIQESVLQAFVDEKQAGGTSQEVVAAIVDTIQEQSVHPELSPARKHSSIPAKTASGSHRRSTGELSHTFTDLGLTASVRRLSAALSRPRSAVASPTRTWSMTGNARGVKAMAPLAAVVSPMQ